MRNPEDWDLFLEWIPEDEQRKLDELEEPDRRRYLQHLWHYWVQVARFQEAPRQRRLWLENPTERRRRELERAASQGDREAERALTRLRERAGEMPNRSWLRELVISGRGGASFDLHEGPGVEAYSDLSGFYPWHGILRRLASHGGAEGVASGGDVWEPGTVGHGEWRRQWWWGDERYVQIWVSIPSLAEVSVVEGDLSVYLYGSLQDLLDYVDKADHFWAKHYKGQAWAPQVCPRCDGRGYVPAFPSASYEEVPCVVCEEGSGLVWRGEPLDLTENALPHLLGDREAILRRLQPVP